jgi:hypothetical protein
MTWGFFIGLGMNLDLGLGFVLAGLLKAGLCDIV